MKTPINITRLLPPRPPRDQAPRGRRLEIKVRVETRESNDRLMLAITDTGPGLNPEQADKIFEAFSQANEIATRKHGGIGLGLTICAAWMAKAGGDRTVTQSD